VCERERERERERGEAGEASDGSVGVGVWCIGVVLGSEERWMVTEDRTYNYGEKGSRGIDMELSGRRRRS